MFYLVFDSVCVYFKRVAIGRELDPDKNGRASRVFSFSQAQAWCHHHVMDADDAASNLSQR
jgi:hypothetical protein